MSQTVTSLDKRGVGMNEDIKFLAENVFNLVEHTRLGYLVKTHLKDSILDEGDTKFGRIGDWNPYTNTDDFLEVLRALDANQKKELTDTLMKIESFYKVFGDENRKSWLIDSMLWKVDHKTEVLTALIETLKEAN